MKVVLYSAPACPFCVMVKKFLERNNVGFQEIDVSKDKKRAEEMVKKSEQENVPVVDVDGTILVGYNINKLKEALNIE